MNAEPKESYAHRIAFIVEIATRLHTSGTTAQRLEAAIRALSHQLELECEPWSNPTGLILSFSDPNTPLGTTDTTRVIRLAPGENDLNKLSQTDAIAEAVATGQMSLAYGHSALRALDKKPKLGTRVLQTISFSLAAAGLAGLWRLPLLDIAVAAVAGLLIGILDQYIRRHALLKEAGDALSALLAGAVATLAAYAIAPLNLNAVIVASLVILLPGMSLTNAVNELSSQHWVSGTVRLAGAATTVMKLSIGAIIAVTLLNTIGLNGAVHITTPQPDWIEWLALPVTAFAFAISFKAAPRDYPWVIAAAIAGYLIARYAGLQWGAPAGIFLAALVMTSAGNAFGRWIQRPGAIVRLPGTIMLVPGSASLRGLMTTIQQQDAHVGQTAAISILNISMAIIAGLLFGNLLLPARKNL